MRLTDEGNIDLGDGGLIRNTAANEKLLRELQETEPLTPEELVKLTKYFKAYPANVSLGNHLALLALATADGDDVLQKVLAEYLILCDPIEDAVDGVNDTGQEDSRSCWIFARWIPVSGVGLLIETIVMKGRPVTQGSSFIVGVSPNPAKLPDA
jgi:hypothetical protein